MVVLATRKRQQTTVIFGINTTSDISKLLYVILRAVRRVKFETTKQQQQGYHRDFCSWAIVV